MTRQFYIATKLERALAHNAVRNELLAAGWQITYDWTAHGSVQGEGEARIRELAEAETKGVEDAQVVVVLLPGGRGTHAELGIAIASGALVFVCCEDDSLFMHDERTCAFYWHPYVRRIVGPLSEVARKVIAETENLESRLIAALSPLGSQTSTKENP